MIREYKCKKIIRQFFSNNRHVFSIYRLAIETNELNETNMFKLIPSPFYGKGIAIVAETQDELLEMIKKHYPERFEYFEIEKVDNYYLGLD